LNFYSDNMWACKIKSNSGQAQRAVVNGVKSSWGPVTSVTYSHMKSYSHL